MRPEDLISIPRCCQATMPNDFLVGTSPTGNGGVPHTSIVTILGLFAHRKRLITDFTFSPDQCPSIFFLQTEVRLIGELRRIPQAPTRGVSHLQFLRVPRCVLSWAHTNGLRVCRPPLCRRLRIVWVNTLGPVAVSRAHWRSGTIWPYSDVPLALRSGYLVPLSFVGDPVLAVT